MTTAQNEALNHIMNKYGPNYNGFRVIKDYVLVYGYANEMGGLISPDGHWQALGAYETEDGYMSLDDVADNYISELEIA